MVAKSGDLLLQEDAVAALRERLLPLALVVTPNLPESEVLSGRHVRSIDDAREAARAISFLGARFVVVKGGHYGGPPVDLVYDGSSFMELDAKRIDTANTHGTGCTFSAAITANLARGLPVLDAIDAAKRYITDALRASYPIGGGQSPVNHFFGFRPVPREYITAEGD
jgi:hydroxymethylpyrimidine/phosphomethylpyrimidine kinase